MQFVQILFPKVLHFELVHPNTNGKIQLKIHLYSLKYTYFSMARSFNVADNRHLQRILEISEEKWKKNNAEVKRIDKVQLAAVSLLKE